MGLSTLPLTLDLTIYAGAALRREYRWLPDGQTGIDFTGWSGVLLVGPSTGVAELVQPVTLGPDGLITVELDATQTDALGGGSLAYQVDLTDPAGDIWRFVRGRATVVRDLHRP